jgi:RNA polymerase sigma factor (sigma-70 family)
MLRFKLFPDQDFIERIKANDRTVLGEIFIRFERMIHHYITSHGGGKNDAEDILQESVIVLWQKVNSGNFELTSKLSTFIMAVAKNKWMAELRKRDKISGQEIPHHITSGNPTMLEEVISAEKINILRSAMEQIQPICKKILLLFYFEEKCLEEIARILNFANSDVVKSKKYQCKKLLEEILKKQFNLSGGDF